MGIGASQLGDAILFPAPPASYGLDLPGLVWIEENFQPLAALPTLSPTAAADQATQHIARRRLQRLFPACLIEAPAGSECKCVILYWHGNSCDLGQIYEEMEVLAKYLNCHVFAIEFPGYGIAPPLNGPLPEDVARAAAAAAAAAESTTASSARERSAASAEAAALQQAATRARQERKVKTMGETINEWSRSAFNFLLWLGIKPEAVICFGRSIGTGPASYLAATLAEKNVRVGGVVLHAPYLSVHKIVQEYSSLGTWLISNHWNNAENLSKMSMYSCPLLIIHGEDDEVIPTEHGRKLLENYSAGSVKEGYFPSDSSHNSYYIIDDLGKPMEGFLSEKSRVRECKPLHFSIPPYICAVPAWQMPTAKTAGTGAAGGAVAAADAATQATVSAAPDARAAAVAAAAGVTAATASQKVVAEQPGLQQKSTHGGTVSPWAPAGTAAKGGKGPHGAIPGAGGDEADSQAAGKTAAKSVGGSGLGAAATALLGRGGTALGSFIAHAAGSTGNEWDVGVTHADSLKTAGATQTRAPASSAQAAVPAKNAGDRTAAPAVGESGKTEAGIATKGAGVETRQRSGGPRFSEVLESGIFSASTLQEIMGETLKELNTAGEDSPTKVLKR